MKLLIFCLLISIDLKYDHSDTGKSQYFSLINMVLVIISVTRPYLYFHKDNKGLKQINGI